jgi:hypothetical protein
MLYPRLAAIRRKRVQQRIAYPGGLGDGVRAYRFPTWKNSKREPNRGQANVEIDIEDANDDKLSARGLLSKLRFLLQPM